MKREHTTVRSVPSSTQSAKKNARNAQLRDAAVRLWQIQLTGDFPVEVALDAERDDAPITQLHVHNAFELGCCVSGSGTLYVGAKILPFREGDMTVLTDHEFHRYRSSPGTISRWAWFFFEPSQLLVPSATPSLLWEPARFSGARFLNVLHAADYPRLADLVRQLMLEARNQDRFSRANLRALLLLIVNELHRRFPKPRRSTRADPSAQSLARIAPALERMATGFHSSLTVPELASHCGMGVRSFQQHFSRLIGHSPQLHLGNSRVQAAAAMLANQDGAISDIAHQCGYDTLSSFNRAFRAKYCMSPREYRKQNQRPGH